MICNDCGQKVDSRWCICPACWERREAVMREMLAALKDASDNIRHIASEGNSCEGEECVACRVNAAIARAEEVLGMEVEAK